MNTSTREDLLGFVLGALDAQEHQQVIDCLNARPELQLELQRLQAQLAFSFNPEPTATADFPAGLARRTCEVVARESRRADQPVRVEPNPPSPILRQQSASSKRARFIQSAAMVCCAAFLGAAIGPLAYGALTSVGQAPATSLAVSNPTPKPTPTKQFESSDFGDMPASSSEVAFIGQVKNPTHWPRLDSPARVSAHLFPIKRNFSPAIQFISK